MNKYFDRIEYGRYLSQNLLNRYAPNDTYILASYLLYEAGMREKETIDFIKKAVASTTNKDREQDIHAQVSKALEHKADDIGPVDIFKTEMEDIKNCGSLPEQKLLFTLLCMAKYGNSLNSNNENWVSFPRNFIFGSAGIHISRDEQDKLIYRLKLKGLLLNSKKVDNNSIKVLLGGSGDSGTELSVKDLRGLGAVYQSHVGGPKMRGKVLKCCAACDTPYLDTTTKNNSLYCPTCRNYYKSKRKLPQYMKAM